MNIRHQPLGGCKSMFVLLSSAALLAPIAARATEIDLEKTASGCRFHFPAYKGFDYIVETSTDLKKWSVEVPVPGEGIPHVSDRTHAHDTYFVRVSELPRHEIFVDSVDLEGTPIIGVAASGDGRFTVLVCEEAGGTVVLFADIQTEETMLLRRNTEGHPVQIELKDGTRFIYSEHDVENRTATFEIYDDSGASIAGPVALVDLPAQFFGLAPPDALSSRALRQPKSETAGFWDTVWWVTDTTVSVTSTANDFAKKSLGKGTAGTAVFVAGLAAKAATGQEYQNELQNLALGLSGLSCVYATSALVAAPPSGGISLAAAAPALVGCASFVKDGVEWAHAPRAAIGIEHLGALSFGEVEVTESASKTLKLANYGNKILKVFGISLPEGYSVDWSEGFIDPGSSKVLTVTFSPLAEEVYEGIMTIRSDADSGSASPILTGMGSSLGGCRKSVENGTSFIYSCGEIVERFDGHSNTYRLKIVSGGTIKDISLSLDNEHENIVRSAADIQRHEGEVLIYREFLTVGTSDWDSCHYGYMADDPGLRTGVRKDLHFFKHEERSVMRIYERKLYGEDDWVENISSYEWVHDLWRYNTVEGFGQFVAGFLPSAELSLSAVKSSVPYRMYLESDQSGDK